MKKKTIGLNRKLVLNKETVSSLNANAIKGGDSLECNTFNCTVQNCGPNGSANCQSVFQCPSDTVPGQNKCVLEEMPSFGIACPPVPQTYQCTIITNGCSISQL